MGSLPLPGEACRGSSPACVPTPTASPWFVVPFPGALCWVPLHFSVFKTQSPASSVLFSRTTPAHGDHLPFSARPAESLPGAGMECIAVCQAGPSPRQVTCLCVTHPPGGHCQLPLRNGRASGWVLTLLPTSHHPDEREVGRFFQDSLGTQFISHQVWVVRSPCPSQRLP